MISTQYLPSLEGTGSQSYDIIPPAPILRHVNRKTDPKKTEYEKETKETMETEQKVIVLRTIEYCTDCGKNKGMI